LSDGLIPPRNVVEGSANFQKIKQLNQSVGRTIAELKREYVCVEPVVFRIREALTEMHLESREIVANSVDLTVIQP
jgi:hypothetical protein